MPCDMVQVNTLDFSTAKGHEDILAEALRALGYTVQQSGKSLSFYKTGVSGTYSNGTFRTQNSTIDLDAVKQQFSRTVVKTAARKFGWQFTEKAGKIQLRKRI